MSTKEITPVRTEIAFDEHDFGEVGERLGAYYKDYVFNPADDPYASLRLEQQSRAWQQAGSTVVFTSGVYDLLHHDHKGYLLHTKLTGAETHYKRHLKSTEKSWDELTTQERQAISNSFLERGDLRLIVSVDGDLSVASRKGGKTDKGGAPRPITGWETRARSVADVTVPVQDISGNWRRWPLADAVTMHGPLDFRQQHIHHTLYSLAEFLQPDVWAIYGESQDILEAVPHISGLGRIALRCIPHQSGNTYFTDTILGKFSTSSIVRRANGQL